MLALYSPYEKVMDSLQLMKQWQKMQFLPDNHTSFTMMFIFYCFSRHAATDHKYFLRM